MDEVFSSSFILSVSFLKFKTPSEHSECCQWSHCVNEKRKNVLRLLRVWPDKHASHALYRKDKKCFGCCKDNSWKPFFLCSVIFFFGRLLSWLEAHMRNDLDYNGSDGKDPFFSIVFFFFPCVDIFVRICFKLLLHFADQVKSSFFLRNFFFTFCHWVNAKSCNQNPLLRKVGLRYSTLL